MAAHRTAMSELGAGPDKAAAVFANYLHAERNLGRISADGLPDAIASLLIGACFHEAFLRYYAHGADADIAPCAFAESIVDAVVAPLGVRGHS